MSDFIALLLNSFIEWAFFWRKAPLALPEAPSDSFGKKETLTIPVTAESILFFKQIHDASNEGVNIRAFKNGEAKVILNQVVQQFSISSLATMSEKIKDANLKKKDRVQIFHSDELSKNEAYMKDFSYDSATSYREYLDFDCREYVATNLCAKLKAIGIPCYLEKSSRYSSDITINVELKELKRVTDKFASLSEQNNSATPYRD